MRIAYVYFNDLTKKTANVNQTLNMVSSLGKVAEVDFYCNYVSNKDLQKALDFFLVEKTFKVKKLASVYTIKHKLIEFGFRFAFQMQVLLRTKFSKYDAIYTRDFSLLFLLSKMPRAFWPKQKIYFEPHIIHHVASAKVSVNQERDALEACDYFVPISKGIGDELESEFGVPKKDIIVLHDGVNLKNFEGATPNKDFFKKRKKKIVYIGSFQDWKGVDTLVKSVKNISKDAMIYLVGGIGKDRERIEQIIKDERISERVVVEGFLSQDEVRSIMIGADIAILPNVKVSISEKYTSPLKLFEYLACGVPIVCSDLPSMREVMEKENGAFFEAGNEKDLAKKVNSLLKKDKKAIDKIKKANIAKAKKYSWDSRAEKIVEFIEKKN